MNWQTLISDLANWGLTQVEIAKRCGCRQSRISELANGKSTSVGFELGAALSTLHKSESRKRGRRAVQAEPASVTAQAAEQGG
ncbi:hypothetical protein [Hydrogenophaga sp.]|uniref:hypothetical protein n=1 Tax=Hydrogenophaga sp. TaxID=1904254 RepID=UPI003F71ACD5